MAMASQISTSYVHLRHRYRKWRLAPAISVIPESLEESHSVKLSSAVALPATGKQIDSTKENKSWIVREVKTNEDLDSLFIDKWKIPIMQLWSVCSLLNTLVDVYTAYVVYNTSCHLAEELSLDWKFTITIVAFVLQLASSSKDFLRALVQTSTILGEWPKSLRLVGVHVPLVDIVIPCCNEPLDVLQDTIRGVLGVDYPHHKYRLVVADDGASRELRDWIASLKCDRLYYHARKRPEINDYKSGNLNQAISFMSNLPGGPAGYIASLDADMIPEKRWLRAVMPHIVLDSKVGMVCPSQSFYHTPHNDLLCQDGRTTWNTDAVYRHLATYALNSGSGFVIRRKAILHIGGFPAPSLLEDTYSSVLMMAKGWRTIYLSEALQYGLVPGSYMASVKQFVRWQVGSAQLSTHFNYFLRKRHCGALTLQQRVSGLVISWDALCTPFTSILAMIAIPFHLVFIGSPIIFQDLSTTVLLIRLQCISRLWAWFSSQHRTLATDFRAVNRSTCRDYYMAPYYARALAQMFFLPTWLGGAETVFTASGSVRSQINERDPTKRAPLLTRTRFMLFDLGVVFHLSVILFTLLALAWALWIVYSEAAPGMLYYELIRSIAWAIPSIAQTVFALAIPVQYMLAPPDVAPRDEAMGDRDETGAKYPKNSSRDSQSTSRWHFGLPEACDLTVIYSALLFMGTFWV